MRKPLTKERILANKARREAIVKKIYDAEAPQRAADQAYVDALLEAGRKALRAEGLTVKW